MKFRAYDAKLDTEILALNGSFLNCGTEIEISKRELTRYNRYIQERAFWDRLIRKRVNEAEWNIEQEYRRLRQSA
jgi:hypothetical protein